MSVNTRLQMDGGAGMCAWEGACMCVCVCACVCVRVCVLYVCVDTSTPAQGVGSRKKDSLERGQPSAFAGV